METGQVVRLFNPRTDDWSTHFRLQDGRIIPLTPVVRVTEYLLQFNLPEYLSPSGNRLARWGVILVEHDAWRGLSLLIVYPPRREAGLRRRCKAWPERAARI